MKYITWNESYHGSLSKRAVWWDKCLNKGNKANFIGMTERSISRGRRSSSRSSASELGLNRENVLKTVCKVFESSRPSNTLRKPSFTNGTVQKTILPQSACLSISHWSICGRYLQWNHLLWSLEEILSDRKWGFDFTDCNNNGEKYQTANKRAKI